MKISTLCITHISRTVSNRLSALRLLQSILRSISQPVLLSLITSLILMRLDLRDHLWRSWSPAELAPVRSQCSSAPCLSRSKVWPCMSLICSVTCTGCGSRSPSPLINNIRVMMIVSRLRGNITRTAVCWIVWHNVHSQQHTYMSSSYRSNVLVLSHWDPYAVRTGGCIIVTWSGGFGGIQAWFRRPTGFFQCFDTVGLVIWPIKIVPEMTCKMCWVWR